MSSESKRVVKALSFNGPGTNTELACMIRESEMLGSLQGRRTEVDFDLRNKFALASNLQESD